MTDLPAAEPLAPARRAFPTFFQALILCAAFIVLTVGAAAAFLFASTLLSMLLHKGAPVTDERAMIGIIGAANLVAFALLFLLAYLWSGLPLRRLFPFRRIRPSLLVPMAMTVLGLHIVLSEMDNLLRSVLPPPDDIMEIFRSLGEGTWATALTLVVVAPVTEELFFRGVVLGGFLRNYRSVTAVLLSSLLFAVIHLNPWQFAAAFILGIVFAWWFIRTESLWPSLLGHTLANGLVAVILYFPLEIPGYNVIGPDTPLQPWWFDLAGATLALTGLLWTRHLFRRHP